MGTEIDVRERLEAKMEGSAYNANGIFAKELEDELMKFTKKSEDCKVETNMVKEVQRNTDEEEANITECTNSSRNNEVVETEHHDTTECSSSFDDSDSAVENIDDDSEALSDFRGDQQEFENFRMRKKKLTTHWRSFVEPLMWRCKWVELQIKKLQSQAQQHDRELEAHNKRKQIQLENSTPIDGVKSLPFSEMNSGNSILKRKRRRKAEATSDLAEYLSRHNLFSYYENRKGFTEGSYPINEAKNSATQKVNIDDELWATDELLSFEAGDGDNSLEHMLSKIDYLQSQVGKLKSRVDKVMIENAEKISCIDNSSLDMPSHLSPPNSGDRMGSYIAYMSEYYSSGDILVPESAGTSHGEVPDTNDGVLIDNERVKEEMNNYDEVKIQTIQKPSVLGDGSGNSNSAPPVVAEPNLPTDNQPPQKIRSISKITAPKSKRRRIGRRKGAGRWTRRSTG